MSLQTKIIIGIVAAIVLVGAGYWYYCQSKVTLSTFSENDLVGAWKISFADPADPECKKTPPEEPCIPNDSEEMDFAIENGDHVFNSYLHHRPEFTDCTWSLKKDALAIMCASHPKLDLSYRILSLTKDSLTVTEDAIADAQTWQRI